MIMEDKSVKVNCSFCGKEIECPENMLDIEKHSCFECFEKIGEKMSEEEINRVHVDIPGDKADEIAEDYMINNIMDLAFPRFWKDEKENLKDMSRKDAVFYAFGSGARTMIDIMKRMDEEDQSKAYNKKTGRN